MANLLQSTREYWDRTVKDEVWMKIPVFNLLLQRNKDVFDPGTSWKCTRGKADLESSVQEYHGGNTPLTASETTTKETAEWYAKEMQIGLIIPRRELFQNKPGESRIFDLKEDTVKQGRDALRLKMRTNLYRTASAARDADAVGFQGIVDALTHDVQYGGLTRTISSGTNTWWQGASVNGLYTDQATAATMSIAFLRQLYDACSMYGDVSESNFVFIVGPTNWRTIQAEAESHHLSMERGESTRWGITDVTIDSGIRIVVDPYLKDTDGTRDNYVFGLHLPDWKLKIDPERGFGTMGEWVDQSQIEGGRDIVLARSFVRGNLMCGSPRNSIYRSDVS